MGHSELIFGSMYSGKTAELLRRINRYYLGGKTYQLFKPKIDNRYSDQIETHDSAQNKENIQKIVQLHVKDIFNRNELVNDIYKSLNRALITEIVLSSEELFQKVHKDTNVIGIDEIQFFDEGIINVIKKLEELDKIVIITGLDMYSYGKPFGNIVPYLACTSKYVTKLHAVCVDCGDTAYVSYKLINNSEQIDIGSHGKYIALCEACARKREELRC